MLYKVPLIECKGESNVNHKQKYMQGLNHEACGIVDALGRDNESRQEGGMKNKPKSPWSLGTTCDLLKSKMMQLTLMNTTDSVMHNDMHFVIPTFGRGQMIQHLAVAQFNFQSESTTFRRQDTQTYFNRMTSIESR